MTFTRRRFISTSAVSLLALSGDLRAQLTTGGNMLAKVIPATGETLPVIGLGTLEAFDVGGTTAERTSLAEVLKALVAQGGTLVDTSPRYGKAESVIGDLLAAQQLQNKVFIATKVFSLGQQAGIDEMNKSFELLQVPQIDLMQVHSLRDWKIHLPSINKLKEAGKVRLAGITIHRDEGHAEMLQIMREQPIDFVQVNYNLVERNAAEAILPLARDKGIAVMVNVPFAKADLFGITSAVALPEWTAEFDCTSWAQFFLKYIVSHPSVTCVIPRTSKASHMKDNLLSGFGAMPDQPTRMKMEKFIDALRA